MPEVNSLQPELSFGSCNAHKRSHFPVVEADIFVVVFVKLDFVEICFLMGSRIFGVVFGTGGCMVVGVGFCM